MADAEMERAFRLQRAVPAVDAHCRDYAKAYGDHAPEALRHALKRFPLRPDDAGASAAADILEHYKPSEAFPAWLPGRSQC